MSEARLETIKGYEPTTTASEPSFFIADGSGLMSQTELHSLSTTFYSDYEEMLPEGTGVVAQEGIVTSYGLLPETDHFDWRNLIFDGHQHDLGAYCWQFTVSPGGKRSVFQLITTELWSRARLIDFDFQGRASEPTVLSRRQTRLLGRIIKDILDTPDSQSYRALRVEERRSAFEMADNPPEYMAHYQKKGLRERAAKRGFVALAPFRVED